MEKPRRLFRSKQSMAINSVRKISQDIQPFINNKNAGGGVFRKHPRTRARQLKDEWERMSFLKISHACVSGRKKDCFRWLRFASLALPGQTVTRRGSAVHNKLFHVPSPAFGRDGHGP